MDAAAIGGHLPVGLARFAGLTMVVLGIVQMIAGATGILTGEVPQAAPRHRVGQYRRTPDRDARGAFTRAGRAPVRGAPPGVGWRRRASCRSSGCGS